MSNLNNLLILHKNEYQLSWVTRDGTCSIVDTPLLFYLQTMSMMMNMNSTGMTGMNHDHHMHHSSTGMDMGAGHDHGSGGMDMGSGMDHGMHMNGSDECGNGMAVSIA